MACPHGANSTPSTCSQCLRYKPRLITITRGGELRVNGRRFKERLAAIPAMWKPPNAGKRKPPPLQPDDESGDDAP